MKFLYNIGVRAYWCAIVVTSIFKPKAKKWLLGRKNIFEKLEKEVPKGSIWIHAASLGEFEQGRPLIESIKKKHLNQPILLTFFSPSGYEIRKNYKHADNIFYLPLDTKSNAKRFVEIVEPKLAIFIKYEFWYHYINELHLKNIPIYSISAVFRPSQIFFKSYGNWFQKMLRRFEHIFVQNQSSLDLLLKYEIKNASLTGDTRVDRVWDICQKARIFPIIESFATQKPILIAGSTWQPDEVILADFCKKNTPLSFKIIIAPHEIDEAHIESILKIMPSNLNIVRYSKAKNHNVAVADILIIDNIGMLSALYRYGKWAYIGGAFGSGLHNTLEPIAFGLPVIFGEKYQKFEEAQWLVENGGGFTINNLEGFENTIEQLQQEGSYKKASQKASKYIEENRGATKKIRELIIIN
ncbi:MAG: 3-deoxy-D-manno-octulosonic acid transferase [Saprospiraceae bacterium]